MSSSIRVAKNRHRNKHSAFSQEFDNDLDVPKNKMATMSMIEITEQ